MSTPLIRSRFFTSRLPSGRFTNLRIGSRHVPNREVVTIDINTTGIRIDLTVDHAIDLINQIADQLDAIDPDNDTK